MVTLSMVSVNIGARSKTMSLLVHEVAKKAEISVDTVRRLDRKGLINSKRDANNWRRYPPEVVATLRRLYGKD